MSFDLLNKLKMIKKTSRKAQIQMAETIAIIIVVMIILILGMIMYSKIKEQDLNKKKNQFNELDIVKLSQIVYNLPEIQCSFAEVADYGCIDKLKLKALAEIITNSYPSGKEYFYYKEIFGNSNISIQIIYPDNTVSEIELYHTDIKPKSVSIMRMPIIVLEPATDKTDFGVLIIKKFD